MTGLNPPVVKNWAARYDPQPLDFNTYVRDTFNFLASPPKLRVTANAVQTGIASGVWTTLVMGSVLEDNYSGWTTGASNSYTAPVAGRYGMTLTAFAAVPAGYIAEVGIQCELTGTVIGPFEYGRSWSELSPWAWDAYDEIYLAVGDQVWPQFAHGYTSAVSTSITNPSAFEIVWLSE
jgi:hypothetical protein